MEKTIVIMEAPDNATGIDQISEEHHFFLGAFGEVIGALKQVFPEGDFSDPTNITIKSEIGNITIEINKHTPVQNFTIRGEGELPLAEIMKLCKITGWRALDTDTGRFLDDKSSKGNKDSKAWWKFW